MHLLASSKLGFTSDVACAGHNSCRRQNPLLQPEHRVSACQQPQQHHCRQLPCQAVKEQPEPLQSLVSSLAQVYRNAPPAAQAGLPCSFNTSSRRHPAGREHSQRARLCCSSGLSLPANSSYGGMPSSPPIAPQRAATQKGSSVSSTTAPQASAAAGTLTAPFVTSQEQRQQQQQHSLHQQDGSMPQAHVWLPEKQLWVPHSAAAVANSSNPLSGSRSSSSSSSSGSALTRVFMASSATPGRKARMEDRHVLAALHPEHGVAAGERAVAPHQAVSLAAVFDGHAGDATATYAAQHIPRLLHNALSGRHEHEAPLQGGPAALTRGLLTPRSALAASFQWFDKWWADARCDPSLTKHGWDDSGSTAVISMVSGQQLVVANAGDSIALVAHNGSSFRLTEEHRLDNEAEAARVREAGGRVVRTRPGGAARLMGTSTQTRYKGSMVTRSLGDFAFKSPQALISAEPFVNTHTLDPTDRLVLLTSDGVTDVLPDDDMLDIGLHAIEQARGRTNNGNALAKAAAKAVMESALAKGSTDNITVVAMLLDWGSHYDDDEPTQ